MSKNTYPAKIKRTRNTVATLAASAALFVSAAPAQAAAKRGGNYEGTGSAASLSANAQRGVQRLAERILGLSRVTNPSKKEGQPGASTTELGNNFTEVDVITRSRHSLVPRAGRDYTLSAVFNTGRKGQLLPSRVQTVELTEGGNSQMPFARLTFSKQSGGNWHVTGDYQNPIDSSAVESINATTDPTYVGANTYKSRVMGRDDLCAALGQASRLITDGIMGRPTGFLAPAFPQIPSADGSPAFCKDYSLQNRSGGATINA